MPSLTHLPIPQPHIALFGSGNSIHNISKEAFETIKANAFVVTLNYAPIHLNGHLNMWSDRKVSDFLQQHYSDKPKDCLLLAQEGRVPAPFNSKIDYFFDRKKENLEGNYTIVWALQLLQKYFPDKKILLFGVDMYSTDNMQAKWYDRYTDFDRKKRGLRYRANDKLNQCAKQINQFVAKDKVYNCNPESRLQCFEKKNWQELIKLNILHLCPSSLAGAPVHLSKIISKYTACESKTILRGEFKTSGLNKLRWDYDIVRPSKSQLDDAVDWADIIHYHRAVYPQFIKEKPSLIQFHSPANGYVPQQTHKEFNGRKLVIAQYHPRFYTDAAIVPNMIDIWEEQFSPAEKSIATVNIFYSWASERKGSWSDKGSTRTISILKKIKAKYGNRVVIEIMNNRSYEDCMAWKRKAHICIDECVTGSYHLQSLEGCAIGATTFNNIDEQTLGFMSEVSNTNKHPFVKTNLEDLLEKLCYYIDNQEVLEEKGRLSRQWMEEHWNPKKLVQRFTSAYFNILSNNTVLIEKAKPEQTVKEASSNNIEHQSLRPKPALKQNQPSSEEEKIINSVPSDIKPLCLKQGKSIQQLHQKYRGQDIYIFGTGPSLFEINPEEYRDKLCFGINYSFEVMPHMDFVFLHVIETYEAIRKVVDNDKLILPETLVRQFYRNQKKNTLPARISASNADALIYPIQNPGERNIEKKSINLNKDTIIFTWSTTTHSAIHVAAYMGAKNIYLIGMDYKLFPDGKVHFNSKHSPIYGAQEWEALRKHKQGDEWLERALAKQNINLHNLSSEAFNLTKIGGKTQHSRLVQG